MSKNEMLERSHKALTEFSRLPPEEQFRRLVHWGVIDNNGEVIFSREDSSERAAEAEETVPHSHNGTIPRTDR